MTAGETPTRAYCGACGAELSSSARFCRACGAAQEAFLQATPQPPPAPAPSEAPTQVQPAQRLAPPAPPPLPHTPPPAPAPPTFEMPSARGSTTLRAGAILAILGGAVMILMVLEATLYYPLQHDYPFNYGESLQFGDLLAFGSGLAAVLIGALVLRRPPAQPLASGICLVAAGVPTLLLAVVWAFPETFNLTFYPQPFYFGIVYFAELGKAHVGDGYPQIPLIASCLAVIVAGVLVAIEPGREARQQQVGWR